MSAHSSKSMRLHLSTTAASFIMALAVKIRFRKIEDNNSTLHIGLDFNIDPMSAVVCLRHGTTLLAIDEIVMFGSNTDEMVAEIRSRYGDRPVIIYPDPASRQRKTSAGGRTDLSILQNAGFSVKSKNSHALVRDRINAVNSRLRSSSGDRYLYIDPKCKQTIKGLRAPDVQRRNEPA